MELGVLDQGLRNGHIANVYAFLRIQAEGFKMKVITMNESHPDLQTVKLNFREWIHVFGQIVDVLKNRLNQFVGNSCEYEFGRKLARISLIVINQLINIMHVDWKSTLEFDEEKNEFSQQLVLKSVTIRNLVYGPFQKDMNPIEKGQQEGSFAKEHELMAKNQLQKKKKKSDLDEQQEKINEYEQFLFTHVPKPVNDWNEMNRFACCRTYECIGRGDVKTSQEIIRRLALPIDETLNYILLHTCKNDIKQILVKYFESQTAHDQVLQLLLSKHEQMRKHFSERLSLSLDSIQCADETSFNLLISSASSKAKFSNLTLLCQEVELKYLWQFALISNNRQLLLGLVDHLIRNQKLPTKSMLEKMVHLAPTSTKEELLEYLSRKAIFAPNERSINCILRRLYSGVRDRKSLCMFCKNGNTLADSIDRSQLVQYLGEHQLYEILHWYIRMNDNLKHLLNNKNVNKQLKSLLLAFHDCDKEPTNPQKLLQAILITSNYLHLISDESKDEIKAVDDLVTNGLHLQAFVCLFIRPSADFTLEPNSLTYLKQTSSQLVECAQNQFPFLQRCFQNDIEEQRLLPRLASRLPSLYELLDCTLAFDVRRLFNWQTTNHLRLDNFASMPHFSRSELSGLYGLRANLTFIYFLNRGRPLDAYQELLNSFGPIKELAQQKIDAVARKACLLAFYHCTDALIALACVKFLELLDVDAADLVFHLKIGKVVLEYAAEFLGFNRSEQMQQLGKLLKSVSQSKNRSAQTRLFELLQIAFSRKHPHCSTMVDELFDHRLLFAFARQYSLDIPFDYVRKCIQNNLWLLLTVYAQLYELSPDTLITFLEDPELRTSKNACIMDHLSKAFQSKHLYISKDPSNQKRNPLRESEASTLKRTRDLLYMRIGLRKSKNDVSVPSISPPLATATAANMNDNRHSNCLSGGSSIENASIYNLTELDISVAETSSITSGSFYSESVYLKSDSKMNSIVKNVKSLFSLILMCQRREFTDLYRALLCSTIWLRNPLGALMACSITPLSDPHQVNELSHFDCFCCWYWSSIRMHCHKLQNSNEHDHVNWEPLEFLNLLRDSFSYIRCVQTFGIGLHVFAVTAENPIHSLCAFLVDFRLEKNYYDSLEKLKRFTQLYSELSQMPETQNFGRLFCSKFWIDEIAELLIESSLKAIEMPLEHCLLLQHLNDCEIGKLILVRGRLQDMAKYGRLSQIIYDAGLSQAIGEFFFAEPNSKHFNLLLYQTISKLQSHQLFEEATEIAQLFSADVGEVLINEFSIKAAERRESFAFWASCLNTLQKHQVDKRSVATFLVQFYHKTNSSSIKCLQIAHLLLNDFESWIDPDELQQITTDLWNMLMHLELQTILLTDSNEKDDEEGDEEKDKEEECNPTLEHELESLNHISIEERDQIMLEIIEALTKYGLKLESKTTTYSFQEIFDDHVQLSDQKRTAFDRLINRLLNNSCIELSCLACNLFKQPPSPALVCVIECSKLVRSHIERKDKNTPSADAVLSKLNNLLTNINCSVCPGLVLVLRLCILLDRSQELVRAELQSLNLVERLVALFPFRPEVTYLIRELIQWNRTKDDELIEFICSDIPRLLRMTAHDEDEEDEDWEDGETEEAENDDENDLIEKTINEMNKNEEQIIELANQKNENRSKESKSISLIQTSEILNDQNGFQSKTRHINALLSCSPARLNGGKQTRHMKIDQFLLFARLLQNPSSLGHKLLFIAQNSTRTNEEVVELCIKSHECFSLTCDIEGISIVLQFIRQLITKRFGPQRSFECILRLLTGIRRYSEMRYVFELLRQEHKLELLLNQRIVRSSALRLALLDALKDDKEILPMIALHFSMHREIGQLMETQAVRTLACSSVLLERFYGLSAAVSVANAAAQALQSTATTGQSQVSSLSSTIDPQSKIDSRLDRDTLERILQDLLDASESYERAGCFGRRQRCERLAQLVALQLHLMSSGQRVLRMALDQVDQFVASHPHFHESCILAEAYAPHYDWSTALFQRVLLNGDWQYYRDFCTRFQITVEICQKLSHRFNQLKTKRILTPDRMTTVRNNFQKLITLAGDIRCIYKLAVEHGFVSISSNLLESQSGGYLKDLKRLGKL